MRAVGYSPTPQFASRLCEACVAEGRALSPMRIVLMRCADEDFGTLVYACRSCQHQTIGPNLSLEMMSRPVGKLLHV